MHAWTDELDEEKEYNFTCFICGNRKFIAKKGTTLREAVCDVCGASKRNSDVGSAILKVLGFYENHTLRKITNYLKHLHIYEAQASGAIHDVLSALPNYICSEYFDDIESGKLHPSGVRCEDLQKLSFLDNSFDLIITQDVLEHVADPEKAFNEIYRVLKPNGCHVFSVPIHEGGDTTKRAKVENGEIIRILPPVHHGDPLRDRGSLVFTDFGDDLPEHLRTIGMPTEIIVRSDFYDPNQIPFIIDDESYNKYLEAKNSGDFNNLLRLFLYNNIVFVTKKSKETSMLEWTGERYLPFVDPEISGAEIHYEHLHRYAFAAQFVKGKKVLDFASGEGYGSHMLSKEAELVIGIEIDEKTVKHASSNYIANNLEFIQGSILKVPIEGEKLFDAIICFEAIEHVEEHEELMKEVKRLLKDDGVFIVSSPNKKGYTDDPDYHNPFHLKELYFDEFKNLLNNYFTHTNFFGQRIYTASNLWSLTSKEAPSNYTEFAIKKGDDEFYFSDGNRKVPLYFIAVASNADLNERYNMSSYLVDASNILIEDYKRQIKEVTVVVQGRNEQILNFEGQITDFFSQLKEKDKQIEVLNVAVQGKDEQIQNLEVEITDISGQLTEKDRQLEDLNVTVQGKDAQISDLEVEITDISGQLKEKDKQLDDLNVAVQGKEEQIRTLDGQITNISGQLRDLGGRLRDREMENLKIHSEMNSIKSSVTWRTVMKWHFIIEKSMPQETRRRRWYDLSLIGLRTITNEGWNSFWWKYKQHRASKRVVRSSLKSTKIESPKLDLLSADLAKEENLINKKVSIVIPAKNAGPDFDFTLEKIRNQKGINEIEIIIVDSGSTDDTVKLAEKYGAKVYSIKPEEFNHGLTRNYGAEKATGDFLVFLVQDAIPIGDYWLYNMVNVLESDTKIAAATCRQVPRSDADLFASYAMWGHYKFMGFNKDKIVSANKENFKKLSAIEKRRLSGIDDVCSCMKKDIFDNFKFKKVDFAEDIDLGIRLIESGYKLGFLHSVGVIHSHNRNSDYFMRRYYGSNKSLAKMFNSPPLIKEQDVDLVLNAILSLYNSLKWSIHTLSSKYEKNIELDSFFFVLKDSLSKEVQRHPSNEKGGEKQLEDLLSEFEKICDSIRPINNNFLCEEYLNLLDGFHAYLKNISQSYEITELSGPLYNLFAIWCGSYLGDLFYYKFNDKKVQYVDDLLTGGV